MIQVAKRSELLLVHELINYHVTNSKKQQGQSTPCAVDGTSQKDSIFTKTTSSLERQGYFLGSKIVSRLTIKKGRINDPNTCMVFICKEFWTHVFCQPVSRLQSNTHVRQMDPSTMNLKW
ncbi:bifunctional Transport protein particle (TRAPP) component/NO signaling-Golgi transport ligand-binding domain superfamily [Babesia duncani]|uniref:Bifunctional Transport protein particle (TRAPP) component/NO signaling-Golgi transport ligand-binding domain superfamily n=1 Tax=Babesia duncani TaxID=323732 RepID=A0AAD9PKL2_9APIC|nr:bifunctional Transport protein particle (TRAPP) component/NO signaling-Golgi transport ligand-binding domain superfamily [Babesia duncani]